MSELVAEEWVREGDTSGWRKRWESALCNAYQKIDNNLKDEALAPHSAGSTAVVVLLSPCQIIAASCGDSRAVLYRGNQAIPLTVDQKPDRADEFQRITRSGGRVCHTSGCSRVEGNLAMSRAIGDHDLKQWVISVPEVSFTSRTTDDEFIVLASDGLWDVWSNKALAEFVYKKLRERRKVINWHPSATSPAEFIAVQTVEEALCSRHSGDNISVIVVDLKWPKRRHKKV